MPKYLYICTGCGTVIELPQRGPTDPDSPLRHLTDDGVCGVLRRDWKAEAVNMNRVPGGGREHSS